MYDSEGGALARWQAVIIGYVKHDYYSLKIIHPRQHAHLQTTSSPEAKGFDQFTLIGDDFGFV